MTDVVVTPRPFDLAHSRDVIQIVPTMDNLMSLHSAADAFQQAERVSIVDPNVNRFFKRSLLEVGRLVPPGAEFEVVLRDNDQLSTHGLKSVLIELFGSAFKFIKEEASRIHPDRRSMIYRRVGGVRFDEEHSGWSFGVLCNGTSPEYLGDLLDSIVNAARFNSEANFEILLFIADDAEYDFGVASDLVREFRTDWGASAQISRKKNLLCDAAKFSDIAIMHDRYLLGTNFFREYDLVGHEFGMSVPRIMLPSGRRAVDWALVSSANYTWSSGGLLNYRDASPHAYCPGGFTVLRKTAWQAYPWSESLSWNEHEDVELSRRYQRGGNMLGWVPAPVVTLRDRWVDENPLIPLDDQIELLPGPPVSEMRVRYLES